MANSARYGRFNAIGEAIQSFILVRLEGDCTRVTGPTLFNVTRTFADFLAENDVSEMTANELASAQNELLWSKIRKQINRWLGQGVTPPFAETSEIEDALVTWRHDRYEEHTGFPAQKRNFFDIYSWLGGLRQKIFLLPCLCYLHVLGCDPIFLTDGRGDEGIDCIGVVASGLIRSTVVFVQAKSSDESSSGNEVRMEYAKYVGLPRTERYMKYLTALGVFNSTTGAAYLYMFISNSDIKHDASQVAPKLGVLLRSRRQVAAALSAKYSCEELKAMEATIQLPDLPDLSRNLAPLFARN